MPENKTSTNQIHPALAQMLMHMTRINASDLYLSAGSPPMFRVDGVGHMSKTSLDSQSLHEMARSVMTHEQLEEFGRTYEMNLAVILADDARFRVNIFRQRGSTAMVARMLYTRIPTLLSLGLPPVLRNVALSKRGMVLVVGAAGSGKSTTLAAMINERNESAFGHIVTVEDPIEYIHPSKRCLVSHREIGADTISYENALKNALRQAPDIIMIGEIRDSRTMEAAIEFAETGHLCMSTLHSNNASQAVERVLNFFPSSRLEEIRLQLSLNLRAIISQRLIPAIEAGRAVAAEVLLDTPRIRDLIKHGEIDMLKDAMEQSAVDGCSTFDSALLALCLAGRISPEQALLNADRPNDLRLRLEQARHAKTPNPGSDDVPLKLVVAGKYAGAAGREQASRDLLASESAAKGPKGPRRP